MSEVNQQTEALKQEYMQACVELGNLNYQVQMLEESIADLDFRAGKVKNRMKAINERGRKLASTPSAEGVSNEQQSADGSPATNIKSQPS